MDGKASFWHPKHLRPRKKRCSVRRCAGPVSWQELVRCEISLKFCSKKSFVQEMPNWIWNSSISSHPQSLWRGETPCGEVRFFIFTYPMLLSAGSRQSDAPEKTEYCASWGCSCAGGRKPYPYQQEKDHQGQVLWRLSRDMKGIERYCMYIAHFVGILKDFRRAYHRPIVVINITQQLFIEVDSCI